MAKTEGELHPFLRSAEHQKADLKRGLEDLESDTPSARNDVIATNEVARELGVFDDEKKSPDDYQDGMIVQTRADALAGKLNSAATLDSMDDLRKSIGGLRNLLWAIIVLLALALWRLW